MTFTSYYTLLNRTNIESMGLFSNLKASKNRWVQKQKICNQKNVQYQQIIREYLLSLELKLDKSIKKQLTCKFFKVKTNKIKLGSVKQKKKK